MRVDRVPKLLSRKSCRKSFEIALSRHPRTVTDRRAPTLPLAAPQPSHRAAALMLEPINAGAIFFKEGTLAPEALQPEGDPYAPGWSLLKNLDACELGRKAQESGWTLFSLAGNSSVTVFGLDEQKTIRRAVERILARAKSEKFNSVEILRVTSTASTRFLGICYVTVFTRARHLQHGTQLFGLRKVVLSPGGEGPQQDSQPTSQLAAAADVTTEASPAQHHSILIIESVETE